MTDVNEKVSEQRQKYSIPQPVKKTAREIVCKKTDSEKRDELLINGQSKSFICKSLVSVHYVGKSLEKPRIVPEEPTKSG
jgi:hypothetical protein